MSCHQRKHYRGNEDPCIVKPKFVKSDLHEKNEARFLEIVQSACQIYEDIVDMSSAIKQTLDETYGPTWHVIIGPNFARSVISYSAMIYESNLNNHFSPFSHIVHEKRGFAHIKCNNMSFLIYKYG